MLTKQFKVHPYIFIIKLNSLKQLLVDSSYILIHIEKP